MDKPILFYEVRVHQNRITGGPVYVPAIVEREEAVPDRKSTRLNSSHNA